MSTDRYERVCEIFHAVCELDAEGRRRTLDDECGADASLRSEIEAMLREDARDGLRVGGNGDDVLWGGAGKR